MFEHRARVEVIAHFVRAAQPITDIAVERPLLPTFLRDKGEHECCPTFAKSTRVIARWKQQLRRKHELNLGALVVEEAPFYSEQQIAGTSLGAGGILVHDF